MLYGITFLSRNILFYKHMMYVSLPLTSEHQFLQRNGKFWEELFPREFADKFSARKSLIPKLPWEPLQQTGSPSPRQALNTIAGSTCMTF